MTMLQMLTKVIGAIELFASITLAELVDIGEVIDTFCPIGWLITEFFTTETADICRKITRIRER